MQSKEQLVNYIHRIEIQNTNTHIVVDIKNARPFIYKKNPPISEGL